MPKSERTLRASELLGAVAYDRAGQRLGIVTELICEPSRDGARVVTALVSTRRRHRLLGYERPGIQGPWLLERLADWLNRGSREYAWSDLVVARQRV
jgi:hypothetical protein